LEDISVTKGEAADFADHLPVLGSLEQFQNSLLPLLWRTCGVVVRLYWHQGNLRVFVRGI
jgi:hypothetical protein